jgi:hypothetical protein
VSRFVPFNINRRAKSIALTKLDFPEALAPYNIAAFKTAMSRDFLAGIIWCERFLLFPGIIEKFTRSAKDKKF